MSTENNKPNEGEVTGDQSQTETNRSPSNAEDTVPAAASASNSPSSSAGAASAARATSGRSAADDTDDDDERPSGDMDFGAMLDQYEQEQAAFQEGEMVKGTVLGITERGVVIDFGFKSEGVAPQSDFTENGQVTVRAGEEVEVMIKSMDSPEGYPVLSRADAMRMRAWDDLEQAHREDTPVKGRITERVKGGLRVDVNGVDAFLPGSQVDSRPVRNLDSFRDQELEFKVIKLNRKRSNVVLSRKALLDEMNEGRKGETLNNIEEGIIVEGQIKNLTDYGAFVDLGGVDGLLHVTDMSWGRLQNPAEIFHVGDTVQVKVLKFDRGR
ncbi:MAG: S1 RNA-binding domain-containing protein, partial [Pyrinomonadaceae bacterium]|nr:S1 RNA-binding domain-containing protein [Pyrinomonadaceae bacterium]